MGAAHEYPLGVKIVQNGTCAQAGHGHRVTLWDGVNHNAK